MACHLPVLEQYPLQMANTATAFSYSYIVFSKNCSRFNLRMAAKESTPSPNKKSSPGLTSSVDELKILLDWGHDQAITWR